MLADVHLFSTLPDPAVEALATTVEPLWPVKIPTCRDPIELGVLASRLPKLWIQLRESENICLQFVDGARIYQHPSRLLSTGSQALTTLVWRVGNGGSCETGVFVGAASSSWA